MAYTRHSADWKDFPDTTTPITAAALDTIEAGIEATAVVADGGLQKSTVNVKGDLLVATANDTITRQAVGANSTVLMADSAQTTGVAWTSDLPVAALAPGTEAQALVTTAGVPTWTTGVTAVPVGVVLPYGGSAAPTGYLLCDGTAVSRTGQAALFAVFGVVYGAGDGVSTFNLPDLRGRIPVGLGTNAAVDTLGENDGVAVANRRPQHRHTAHSHTIASTVVNRTAGATSDTILSGAGTSSTSSVDGGSGVATDALDSPAYITLNYIVKV